jgi:tetratricopeptide (TPR) repeat protein
MAGFLEQHLRARGHKILFYRFERSAVAEQSSPTAFAASLLFQLFKTLKAETPTDAVTELEKLTTRFPHGPLNCAFEAIWAVTESVLTSYAGFTLVIDALDEGSFKDPVLQGSASKFLDCVFGAVQKTQSKAVIFSQHDPQFAVVIASCLSIHMSSDVLLPNIMIFAEKEHDRLDLPKEEKKTVLGRVRSSCHGSFRWAALFLDYLDRSLQMADFRARLDSLPPSISDFYKSALTSDSRLDEDEKQCRNTLLAITLQAQRTLKLVEVADALSLRPNRADRIVYSLCKPLISTQAGLVQFSHPSVRTFLESCASSLCTLFSESHGVLAEKCLSTLLKHKYADLECIKMYLKANYGEEECTYTNTPPKTDDFYDYASRFWYHHLALTASPSVELLRKTNTFLLSFQFAFWSQYAQKNFGLAIGVTTPLGRLKSWHSQLPSVLRDLVDIDKCPTTSYNRLSAAYEADETNVVYRWLAHLSLCDYGLALGLPAQVSDPEEAAAELLKLLGPNHPFVLRAKSSVAYARFHAGRMRTGYRIYKEVLEAQRRVVGEDHVRYIEALHYVGEGEYYMADFVAATETFIKSSAGYLRKSGPESWTYLATQCWLASSLAYLNQLDLSLKILESAFGKRRDQFGPWDGFATIIQVGMADVQRALGRREEAIANFKEALESRRGSYSTSDTSRLDVEIVLARTYQEAGMSQNATAAIKELEQCGSLRAHFERVCQVAHIKGLLLASDGCMNEGINCFLEILIQAEEDQNNRALLWIRLDLARLLRQRHDVGDGDLASSIFDNIVKDVSGDFEPGFPDEPDPPRLLAVAEKALKLVRDQRYDEAQRVLVSEKVDWRRPSDFWLYVTDTILV